MAFLQILKNYLHEEAAQSEIYRKWQLKQEAVNPDTLEKLGKLAKRALPRVGVIGFGPLDTPESGDHEDMATALREQDDNPVTYGMNDTLEDVAAAAHVARNIVVSPGA